METSLSNAIFRTDYAKEESLFLHSCQISRSDHGCPCLSCSEIQDLQRIFLETAAKQPAIPLSTLLNAEIAKLPSAIRADMPVDQTIK